MGIVLLLSAVVTGLCVLYGRFVEPTWLTVKVVSLTDAPTITLIHISDIHYKGDRDYLCKVVDSISAMEADPASV